MDALDLLLEDLPTAKKEAESSQDDDALLALEEFQSANSPSDRLEALKLLMRLTGK